MLSSGKQKQLLSLSMAVLSWFILFVLNKFFADFVFVSVDQTLNIGSMTNDTKNQKNAGKRDRIWFIWKENNGCYQISGQHAHTANADVFPNRQNQKEYGNRYRTDQRIDKQYYG